MYFMTGQRSEVCADLSGVHGDFLLHHNKAVRTNLCCIVTVISLYRHYRFTLDCVQYSSKRRQV